MRSIYQVSLWIYRARFTFARQESVGGTGRVRIRSEKRWKWERMKRRTTSTRIWRVEQSNRWNNSSSSQHGICIVNDETFKCLYTLYECVNGCNFSTFPLLFSNFTSFSFTHSFTLSSFVFVRWEGKYLWVQMELWLPTSSLLSMEWHKYEIWNEKLSGNLPHDFTRFLIYFALFRLCFQLFLSLTSLSFLFCNLFLLKVSWKRFCTFTKLLNFLLPFSWLHIKSHFTLFKSSSLGNIKGVKKGWVLLMRSGLFSFYHRHHSTFTKRRRRLLTMWRVFKILKLHFHLWEFAWVNLRESFKIMSVIMAFEIFPSFLHFLPVLNIFTLSHHSAISSNKWISFDGSIIYNLVHTATNRSVRWGTTSPRATQSFGRKNIDQTTLKIYLAGISNFDPLSTFFWSFK